MHFTGTNLYSQIVSIPMGTDCAPPVVDLFLFFLCERHHVVSVRQ